MIACLISNPPDAAGLHALRLRLDGLSPRVHLVEKTPTLTLLLDLGRGTVADGRRHVTTLQALAQEAAITPALGIAPTPTPATLAARRAGTGHALVISPAALPRLLAACPLPWLAPLAPVAATLHGLGLRSLADVAAVPAAAFTGRFGGALLPAWRALHGDEPPLAPLPPLPRLRLRRAFAGPVADRTVLTQVLQQVVQRLAALLDRRGMQARALALHLDGDADQWSAGRVLERPAAAAPTLLPIAAHLLTAAGATDAITTMTLIVGELAPLQSEQHTFFAHAPDARAAGRTALADLAARLGADQVLRPLVHPPGLLPPEARTAFQPWESA